MAEMTMTRWMNSKDVNKLLDEEKAKQAPELEAPSPPAHSAPRSGLRLVWFSPIA